MFSRFVTWTRSNQGRLLYVPTILRLLLMMDNTSMSGRWSWNVFGSAGYRVSNVLFPVFQKDTAESRCFFYVSMMPKTLSTIDRTLMPRICSRMMMKLSDTRVVWMQWNLAQVTSCFGKPFKHGLISVALQNFDVFKGPMFQVLI